jgi:hypothetical protein
MNGAGCGTLSLDIANGSAWQTNWLKQGDQGADWHLAVMPIDDESAAGVRFTGFSGEDLAGDIALDDVFVFSLTTSAPTATPKPSVSPRPTQAPTPTLTSALTTASVTTGAQLQAAVDRSDSVIWLASDMLISSTIIIGGVNVTIDGHGSTLNGQGAVRVLYVTRGAHVEFANATITGGAAASGGGVYVSGSATLMLRSLIIHNNSATALWGGGLFVYVGALFLDDCTIFHNKAFDKGGGLLVLEGSVVAVRTFLLTNSAHNGGGGAAMYFANASFVESSISANVASKGGGGGCLIAYSAVIFSATNVTLNEAFGGGGGIYANDKVALSMHECQIANNTAFDSSGGGLYLSISSAANVSESDVVGNRALASPSFVNQTGSCTVLDNCLYSPGFPGQYGINSECKFVVGERAITLESVVFDTESAFDILKIGDVLPFSGTSGPTGVVVASGASITFSSDGDTNGEGFEICAVTSGGGIFASGKATIRFISSTVKGNAASFRGGGVALLDDSTLRTFDSAIINNDALNEGGGLYVDASKALLRTTRITGNSVAASDGGGSASFIESGIVRGTNLVVIGDFGGPFAAFSAICGSSCGKGGFSDCSAVDGAPSCFANCDSACRPCPPGTASSKEGATSNTTCESCGPGQASTEPGSTECASCLQGRYSSSSSTDTGGGQVVQVVSGASSCSACPSGSLSLLLFLAILSSMFIFLRATGHFSQTKSAILCEACGEGTNSSAGSSSCDLAAEGYYLDPRTLLSTPCPSHANCSKGGKLLPLPLKGYWVARNQDLLHVDKMYLCQRSTCKGGSTNSPDEEACWTSLNYNSSACDTNALECDFARERSALPIMQAFDCVFGRHSAL